MENKKENALLRIKCLYNHLKSPDIINNNETLNKFQQLTSS